MPLSDYDNWDTPAVDPAIAQALALQAQQPFNKPPVPAQFSTLDQYKAYRAAWDAANQNPYGPASWQNDSGGEAGGGRSTNQDAFAWDQKSQNGFYDTLTPAQRAQYQQLGDARYNKVKQTQMLAAAAAMTGGVGLAGMLGEGAAAAAGGGGGLLGGAEASGGFGMNAFGGLAGADTGLGLGSVGALAPTAGLGMGGAELGSALGASVGGALPAAAAGIGAGVPGLGDLAGMAAPSAGGVGSGLMGGAPTTPSLPDVPGAPPGTGSNLADGATGMDWGPFAGAAASMLGSIGQSNTPLPTAPDFTKLAEQTAASNNQQLDAQTLANRSNMTNAQGDTSNWSKGPDGQWTQATKYGTANQNLYDKSMGLSSALRDRASSNLAAGPMSATGNSQDIQNAWMKQLQPQRDIARGTEIQRLKNQGLTEGSPAFQRAMERLDTGDTNAQNTALINGTNEYNNQFNRNRMNTNDVYNQMGQVQGATPGAPQFATTPMAGMGQGTNYTQGGRDQYNAQLANYNAEAAAKANKAAGYGQLAGGLFGNPTGRGSAAGQLGSAFGGIAKGLFGGG